MCVRNIAEIMEKRVVKSTRFVKYFSLRVDVSYFVAFGEHFFDLIRSNGEKRVGGKVRQSTDVNLHRMSDGRRSTAMVMAPFRRTCIHALMENAVTRGISLL